MIIFYDGGLEVDVKAGVYFASSLIAGYFMVAIRSNPGVVSREVCPGLAETGLAQELNQEGDGQFDLPSTVKMRELKSNLLEPDLRAYSTLGNWKNPHAEERELDNMNSNEKCSSDETHRDIEYRCV